MREGSKVGSIALVGISQRHPLFAFSAASHRGRIGHVMLEIRQRIREEPERTENGKGSKVKDPRRIKRRRLRLPEERIRRSLCIRSALRARSFRRSSRNGFRLDILGKSKKLGRWEKRRRILSRAICSFSPNKTGH